MHWAGLSTHLLCFSARSLRRRSIVLGNGAGAGRNGCGGITGTASPDCCPAALSASIASTGSEAVDDTSAGAVIVVAVQMVGAVVPAAADAAAGAILASGDGGTLR